jgi:hypothetical protein
MYSTCLFCNGSLGANTVIEEFPVGERLAFDSAKGRLWVVCRRCERWNLTPVEERWEAIESCERRFRDTRLRISTDNIGLARLREGLELVRIGAPQRPEFAAWRYGDQFGRRRKRKIIRVGVGVGAIGGVAAGLVTAGVAAGVSFAGGWWALSRAAEAGYKRIVYGNPKEVVAHVPVPGKPHLALRRKDLPKVQLGLEPSGAGQWRILVPDPDNLMAVHASTDPCYVQLTGDNAIRAAGVILPAVNWEGASAVELSKATDLVEQVDSVEQLFEEAVTRRAKVRSTDADLALTAYHAPMRLALEMAAHEESERRALEGELTQLVAAWKQAEEIAAIADNLLPEPGAEDFIRRHRPSSS